MNHEQPEDLEAVAHRLKQDARVIACLTTEQKNAILLRLAELLREHASTVVHFNQCDIREAERAGLSAPRLARLRLSADAIDRMAQRVECVASLPDPVGMTTRGAVMPNGLQVRKVRAPLGVIAIIYESRPEVTVDAFALCFKAGNTCFLKGGKESFSTNRALVVLIAEALRDLSECRPGSRVKPLSALENARSLSAAHLVSVSDRSQLQHLLSLDTLIDLVIPRGGKELIRFVRDHSKIPTIQHFEGVCHIFVDESADVDKAVDVCATAKTSAPATCNAAECILVHERIAERFIPRLVERYRRDGVEVRGDALTRTLAPDVIAARDDDWGREFLDLVIAMRVVSSMNDAIAHIDRYASNHTEAILTRDQANAETFTSRVQSSVVLVNASTRFNDGFQLGLGAEIGISTTKLHAYGPMGLEELTTQRYIVIGDGHTR